jgi:DNA-binding response OmpR family regulator
MWHSMQRPDPGGLSSLPEADNIGDMSALREQPSDRTVLLVEDEVVVNFFLKTLFEERGFQVVMTTTAGEALRAIENGHGGFCAAVIDVGLPDRPGDELVPFIRCAFPELPIIIATGFSETEFGRRFESDGRVRVIGKPFDGPHLFAVLNTLDEQFAV